MKVLDRREQLEGLGAEVVVVVHDEPERVRRGILHDLDLPFPVLLDESKGSYRAWGLGRASVLRTWLAPRWVGGYARSLFGRGEKLLRPGRDLLQLGGDFVIAPDGTVAFSRPQENLDERPPVGLLVRELKRVAG